MLNHQLGFHAASCAARIVKHTHSHSAAHSAQVEMLACTKHGVRRQHCCKGGTTVNRKAAHLN